MSATFLTMSPVKCPAARVTTSQKATNTGDPDRPTRGRRREDALFPAASARACLPQEYGTLLADLRQRITQQRLCIVPASNAALLERYADTGQAIIDRQSAEGWGAKVIDRLSTDLKAAFPDMTGLSSRNLKYMRAHVAAWPREAIVQAPLAQLSWNHHQALLDKLKTADESLMNAHQAGHLSHVYRREIMPLRPPVTVRFKRPGLWQNWGQSNI